MIWIGAYLGLGVLSFVASACIFRYRGQNPNGFIYCLFEPIVWLLSPFWPMILLVVWIETNSAPLELENDLKLKGEKGVSESPLMRKGCLLALGIAILLIVVVALLLNR